MNQRELCFVLVTVMFSFALPVPIEEATALEKAEYNVLEREGKFELRQYKSHIVAETMVEGDFEGVGNEGFRRLFDYISGKNRKKQSISMTAPVSQEPLCQDGDAAGRIRTAGGASPL